MNFCSISCDIACPVHTLQALDQGPCLTDQAETATPHHSSLTDIQRPADTSKLAMGNCSLPDETSSQSIPARKLIRADAVLIRLLQKNHIFAFWACPTPARWDVQLA